MPCFEPCTIKTFLQEYLLEGSPYTSSVLQLPILQQHAAFSELAQHRPSNMQLPRLPILVPLASALAFLLSVAALQAPSLPVHTVIDFGLGCWVENIRVRATGEILAVGPFSSTLYQVDPSLATPTKVAVHTFPVGGFVGITETTPDVFYVVTGNFSNTMTPVPGSYAVWQVNMVGFSATQKPALVTRVASFPSAQELNAMTTINSQLGLVVISDPGLGLVWSLNVHTGAQSQVINLPNMKSIAGTTPTLSVNGIHYTNNTLYYTSTDSNSSSAFPFPRSGVRRLVILAS